MHVTEETVDGFAHCIDFVCPGYGQEPVKAVKTIRHDTVGDRGGDGALAMVVENTWEYLRFDDPEKVQCPHCGKAREVALQARPTYQNLSGFAQNGLVQVAKFDANVRNTPADEAQAAEQAASNVRIAELEQQMADLMNALTKE
jgi:hypothetical protein